jgi:hypothetical protein
VRRVYSDSVQDVPVVLSILVILDSFTQVPFPNPALLQSPPFYRDDAHGGYGDASNYAKA